MFWGAEGLHSKPHCPGRAAFCNLQREDPSPSFPCCFLGLPLHYLRALSAVVTVTFQFIRNPYRLITRPSLGGKDSILQIKLPQHLLDPPNTPNYDLDRNSMLATENLLQGKLLPSRTRRAVMFSYMEMSLDAQPFNWSSALGDTE